MVPYFILFIYCFVAKEENERDFKAILGDENSREKIQYSTRAMLPANGVQGWYIEASGERCTRVVY